MAIKSTPFGPTILTGEDAARFREQMKEDPPQAARDSLERGMKQLEKLPDEAYERGWNEALERAAQACEALLTGHRESGPDAARRMCALKIRELKIKPHTQNCSEEKP